MPDPRNDGAVKLEALIARLNVAESPFYESSQRINGSLDRDIDEAIDVMKHLSTELAEAVGLLRKYVPPSEDWWCPKCQTALGGSGVTNDERCDTCGTSLVTDTELDDVARAFLARHDKLCTEAARIAKETERGD